MSKLHARAAAIIINLGISHKKLSNLVGQARCPPNLMAGILPAPKTKSNACPRILILGGVFLLK